ESISRAFAAIRERAGDPDVLVYNAGYLEGRDLPPDKELLEHVPVEIFETAQHVASRGPFLVAQEVLPAMRKRGSGAFLLLQHHFYQPVLAARPQAPHRTVPVLSSCDDAHAGAGADRGVFRARRARGQRRDRRPHRFAGPPGAPASPAKLRGRDESRQDRRGLLLPAHPGQVLLDARAPADAIFDQAELLGATTWGEVAGADLHTTTRGHTVCRI